MESFLIRTCWMLTWIIFLALHSSCWGWSKTLPTGHCLMTLLAKRTPLHAYRQVEIWSGNGSLSKRSLVLLLQMERSFWARWGSMFVPEESQRLSNFPNDYGFTNFVEQASKKIYGSYIRKEEKVKMRSLGREDLWPRFNRVFDAMGIPSSERHQCGAWWEN